MRDGLEARYSCPVGLAVDVLGGKWRVVILARLKEKVSRYSELRRAIGDISDKMLSQRLKELVADGLVEQTAESAYALTAEGERLRPVLQVLYEWGERYAMDHGIRVG